MVTALNANTGSEYDLTEDTFAKDYRIYKTMILALCHGMKMETMENVLSLPRAKRYRLKQRLIRNNGATDKEVAKLLRL
jgi:hypothetical protein